jgi:hypothetical protein
MDDIKQEVERRAERGEFIAVQQESSTPGRSFTTPAMIALEQDTIDRMRAGQGQHAELVTAGQPIAGSERRDSPRDAARGPRRSRGALDARARAAPGDHRVDRQWAERYQEGDVVRYSRGSKALGIEAGDYARVLGAPAGIAADSMLASPGGGGVIGDAANLGSLTAYRLHRRDRRRSALHGRLTRHPRERQDDRPEAVMRL